MSLCQSKNNIEEETEKKNPSLRVNGKVTFPQSTERRVYGGKRNIQVV